MAAETCSGGFEVRALTQVKGREDTVRQIDEVFLANAGEVPADADRDTFRDHWLGRYLEHWPEWFFVAQDQQGDVLGYLAGCPENPERSTAFSDHRYYELFATECVRFPAHMHVNVRADVRGKGAGAALVAAFAGRCRAAGVTGLHAVTAHGDRNNGFFESCGLRAQVTANWHGRDLVFYALTL